MIKLDASDYEKVDKVSQFQGAIIDRCCGFTEATEATTAYAQYVDIVRMYFRNYENTAWALSKIRILKDDIEAYISHCGDLFSPYQASCMGVSKLHDLTHIPDALWGTGEIEYSCGGLYKMTHKAFKDVYRNTSRRKATAMKETFWKVAEKQIQCVAENRDSCYNGQSASTRFSDNDRYIVKSGRFPSVHQFVNCRRLMYARRKRDWSL